MKNLLNKLPPSQCESKELFEQFLLSIEEEGGCVDWRSDPDGSIKSFFIVSNTIKSSLLSSNPTVIQLDTSFGVDAAQYKLTSFCYLNPLTDKREIGAIAFLDSESEENFDFVLSMLSRYLQVRFNQVYRDLQKELVELHSYVGGISMERLALTWRSHHQSS